MYGQYTRDLSEAIKEEAKYIQKQRKKEEKIRAKELRKYRGKWTTRIVKVISWSWKNSFARLGEDWVFLAVLGVVMALVSFIMDYGIAICNKGKKGVKMSFANLDESGEG